MKNLYLIRHAVPEFPDGRKMCIGATDLPLGEAGLAQAREMAAQLPAVTAVFSSPLVRAVQTAEAIGQPVTLLPGLRELYMGQWEGLTFPEIRQRFPEAYEARGRDISQPPPGGEGSEAGLARFREALDQALRTAPGDLAVVTHGGIMALLVQDLTGTWKKPDYAQVLRLTWQEDVFALDL